MTHPLLQHVQRNAVDGGVDPKPMAQSFWASVWCVCDPGLNHNPFHDLPDPYAAERPDWSRCEFARFLRLANAMGGVERVEIIRRYRHGAIDHFLNTAHILALFQRADGNRPAGQIDTRRSDLDQF